MIETTSPQLNAQPRSEPALPPEPHRRSRPPGRLSFKLLTILLGTSALLGWAAGTSQAEAPTDTTGEAEPTYATVMPDWENPAVQDLVSELQGFRLRHGDPNAPVNAFVIADSLGTAGTFLDPSANPYPEIEFQNHSALGARFGYYGTTTNANGEHIPITNSELLAQIDHLENQPEFVMLFLGRNDCSFINTEVALNYLVARSQTGELPSASGFTNEWLATVLNLISNLKQRNIITVIVTSPPMESETHCSLNGRHINLVFAAVAEQEGLPLVVPGNLDYVRDRVAYPLLFGAEAVTPHMVALQDGIHIPTNMYGDINQLFFGSIATLNRVTMPSGSALTSLETSPSVVETIRAASAKIAPQPTAAQQRNLQSLLVRNRPSR